MYSFDLCRCSSHFGPGFVGATGAQGAQAVARARQHLRKQHARAEVAFVTIAEKRIALIIIFFKFTPLTIRKERLEAFFACVKIGFVFLYADKIESQTGASLAR